MKSKIFSFSVLGFALCIFAWSCKCNCGNKEEFDPTKAEQLKIKQLRSKVKHIIIFYQENWSFDGLYGSFPGANNRSGANTYQVDKNGNILQNFPRPRVDTMIDGKEVSLGGIDSNFRTVNLPAKPYNLLTYIKSTKSETGDITHLFYTEQKQIDSGRMDKFAAYSLNPGLVQSYFDATNMPEGLLAQQYTLCDNFFHSAFGGSFLNHIWLISATSPEWKTAPAELVCIPGDSVVTVSDNQVTPDGYAVNTTYSVNTPKPSYAKYFMPYLKNPTIGDRLSDNGISWAWYAGGWNDALAGHPDPTYQFHHQPFIYFENYKEGSENKKKHLKDEADFINAVAENDLPEVTFVKGLGVEDEHPGYSNLERGQQHIDSLVKTVMASKIWDDAVIIIAYDEHGGRWDHVAPPKIDKWGPGSRVPCIIISKFAKKKFIDHTQYETVSILKFIETRFGVSPFTSRDSAANNLLNAFEF